MANLYYHLNDRYQYYLTQQKLAGKPKTILVTMFESLIHRIDDHPYKQRDIIETYQIMPYCKLMKVLFTRSEWNDWKYELRYLSQFLEPSQQ